MATGPPAPQRARVLSIQSHVVHGHVGNKSAVFPLQLLGLEVDFINSVQFSNHTGYKQWKGTVMSGEELWALIEGLEMNDLCHYTHLLTGYIASVSFLETIMKVVEKLRSYNPNLVYVCDPVMGDDGQLYLPSELVPIYKENLPKVATVLMPNAFEAEQLTGVKVVDVATGLKACEHLHSQGTETVVITSLDTSASPDSLTILASTTRPQEPGCPQRLKLEVPYVPVYFTGTGDLTAALTLAWVHKHPDNLGLALSKALGGLQAVLKETMAQAGTTEGISSRHDPKRNPATCRALELRLVQSQEHIRIPPETVPFTALE
eukprot:CAMPEP_0117651494 /NCGR_PEP_ID=MMETSP0804-20121206/2122_1 /TAXON_ID=1074897 /ORGANISM="Tetraselmis astigmatica, Strain CCMP880" /LENGTH=318 /DNA_ID=CAMNT_0005457475 /DNA_START=157 /DNA_END=1113 /DNA_ORIENTATION=+